MGRRLAYKESECVRETEKIAYSPIGWFLHAYNAVRCIQAGLVFDKHKISMGEGTPIP